MAPFSAGNKRARRGGRSLLVAPALATLAIRHNDRALSILLSDADNFKKTNDTYGHVAGDQVLRELAAVIKQSCRALDVAARYGGEEFIVMLPGANEQEAFKVADKIRTALSQKVFKHEKGDFQTTISMGVTQARPGETDIEALVMRADKALYEAKHTGKNKVVIYLDSMAGK
jgi:diguanylate cyclase (GGDEF)-like protein